MQTFANNLQHLLKIRAWSQWLSIEGVRGQYVIKDIPVNVVQPKAPIE
jgi:hypothetical protein